MFVLVVCHGSVKYVRLAWFLQNSHQQQKLENWKFGHSLIILEKRIEIIFIKQNKWK